MAKGLSLHLGLNSVDPKSYEGWSGPLNACEADARDMQSIADHAGFKSTLLLTKQATRDAVRKGISDAAKALKAGDIFLLTNSSHGGQIPDVGGDEPDGQDETWCLFNGELIDDEIYALLGEFAKGVRVFMLSDSCHSGSVARVVRYMTLRSTAALEPYGAPRMIPLDVGHRVYLAHKKFYDAIGLAKENVGSEERVKASVLLISGCQDNQTSADGEYNGLFTGTLKQVWNGGKFKGDYRRFHKTIVSRMPSEQSPNLFRVGPRNKAFEGQHPFKI